MSLFEAIILGIVQGITEFLPVSSSGHLLLLHELLGTPEDSLAFDLVLHVGTLGALFIYFWQDIIDLARNVVLKNDTGRQARLIVVATLPAALAGLLFGDVIDSVRSPLLVAAMLAAVGILMLLAENYSGKHASKSVSNQQGMSVGFAQMLALIPGVSRSGITMTAGLFAGLDRQQAARFSFLLAMPIIAGSALGMYAKEPESFVLTASLMVGFVASLLSGLLAIKFFMGVVKRVGLTPFAYYRFALAFIVFMLIIVL